MHPWFELHEEVGINDLRISMAKDFARFINLHGTGAAQLEGARRLENGDELLMLRVVTGRPQRAVYDIYREELLGILFVTKEGYPEVLSTREDFPDTPHQNLVPPELPFSLCIDDRSWREAKLTYTPAELLQRVVVWFEKAGKGELHEANQPLDPYFWGIAGTAILPGPVFEQNPNERCDLVPVLVDEKSGLIKLGYLHSVDPATYSEQAKKIIFIVYEIQPDRMSRLRAAPNNLALLHIEMESRGVNLLETLADRITNWILEDDSWKPFRFNSSLGILVKMPVIHPANGLTGAHSMMAFLSEASLGDVGYSLGCLDKNNVVSCDLKYVRKIISDQIEIAKVERIKLYPLNVTSCFEPHLAARMAGREKYDQRKVTMIGAGAVGSLVANCLSREGSFNWTIIDNDVLLPHNLARHALTGHFVGCNKALGLQNIIERTVLSCSIKSIAEDVMSPSEQNEEVNLALQSADIILDAAASVPVSRYLCDLSASARRGTFFFNPTGTAAVLMVENAARTVDLRGIEAEFYSQVLDNCTLADLLLIPPERIPYSGNCSALTTRMPTSSAQILSGLIARELSSAFDSPHSLLKIWQLTDEGGVTVTSCQPDAPATYQLGGWEVRLLPSVVQRIQGMRQIKLPCETGGALLGVVDIPAKRIEVIIALPPPSDSEEKPNEFVRGTNGLEVMVKASMARTLDLTRYVGEWHSHPKGCGTRASTIDHRQLERLAETLSSDGCPGIQVISGDSCPAVNLGIVAK